MPTLMAQSLGTAVSRLDAAHDDAYLLSLGLPPSWLPAIRKIVTVDQLIEVAGKLPQEEGDRLLDLADGKLVTPPVPVPPDRPAMESQDSKQRFFVVDDQEDLRRLLDEPLATWLVFLHPSQRRLAYGSCKGPLKVTGSAGTGKTVVALQRARQLAAQGKRVLLTTYTTTLCANLEASLALLCTADELRRITVGTVYSRALVLVQEVDRGAHPAGDDDIEPLMSQAQQRLGCTLSVDLLLTEWETVIQAQGLTGWESYRGASRAGRGTPLSVRERRMVWQVTEALQREAQLLYVSITRARDAVYRTWSGEPTRFLRAAPSEMRVGE